MRPVLRCGPSATVEGSQQVETWVLAHFSTTISIFIQPTPWDISRTQTEIKMSNLTSDYIQAPQMENVCRLTQTCCLVISACWRFGNEFVNTWHDRAL